MAGRAVYAKGIAKREEILGAALAVVAAQGYRGASVRDIADAAGLSPAGLLHYFGSKEELFVAILQARDEHDLRTYADQDATAAFLAVIRHNASVPGLVQLYAQLAAAAGDPAHPAHAYFRERTALLEEPFRELFAAAQERGEIRDDVDPGWIVRTLRVLADGLQSAWLVDPGIDMPAHIEQFLALLRPLPATAR
ncbi:helix-turn-helix domain-containing protein [Microbacterium sp.]|uniref:TetR/AcrR family transcriptional regulator n=1 Tax=Microbacterium sp. TaxID=51671 RepID=UPI0033414628